jgi:AcrR family transcriptional regulator
MFILMPRRPSYHHGDLKRALVAAGAAILEEHGLSALTLRAVAERARVTAAAPYHHFPSKEHLLAAIAIEGFGALYAEQLAAAAAAGEDARARLKAIGVAYVRFADQHRGYFAAMFRANLAPWDRFEGLREAARLPFFLLQSTVAEVGHTRTDAMAIWALVHGVATLWADGPFREHTPSGIARTAEEVVERFVGRLG